MEPVYAAPHEQLLASPSALEGDPLAVVDDVLAEALDSAVLGSLVGSLGGTGEGSAVTVGRIVFAAAGSGGTGMNAGNCSCVSGSSGRG